MQSSDHSDVLIIGAGASGAAVAWKLAQGGLSVTCLEQGGWVDAAGSASTDPLWEVLRLGRESPYPNIRQGPGDYPVNDADSPIKPLMWNGVGGGTIKWGAHFPRFRPSDFRVRSLDGVADDWPLSYAELEPYYDENDRIMGVAGLAGDPANPPRAPRPMPPLPLGTGATRMAAAFDRLGWHWWPSDAALNSRAYRGRAACNNCGPCDLGCPGKARSSVDVTYWPLALAAGARLITQARVFEVLTDADGRAAGAAYVDAGGQARRHSAGLVVLAANGAGTPRLLLLSRSAAFPDGLANRSGLVGKRLMYHPTAMVTGIFAEPLDGYKGPFACSILCQQFYETDPGRDFLRGYQMQMIRSDGPLGTALGGYLPRIPWGRQHHAEFLRRFGHTASLTVTTEDLPRESNRITLDPLLTDRFGIPAPRFHYRLDDNTERMIAHGIDRARQAFTEAGALRVESTPLVAYAGFHLLGTARMGNDPATSVTDRFGRAHDSDSLFIVDGSLFVTAAALNPTPTLQALALRAADHILATQRDHRPATLPTALGWAAPTAPPPATHPPPPLSATARALAQFSTVMGLLLPGDAGFPSGDEVALDGPAADLLDLPSVAAAVAAALPQDFTEVAPEQQSTALDALQQAEPALFERLLATAYAVYYRAPAVIAAIAAGTSYDGRPPQPLGHSLPPFDPLVLDRVRRSGASYRPAP